MPASLRLPLRAWPGIALIVAIAAAAAASMWHRHALADALVRATPEQLQHDGSLVRYALARAPDLYKANCASCHGENRHGNRRIGAADLADGVWLYGDGGVDDIENTLLYGIRSGHPKSHNFGDMPALGRTRQLAQTEVDDLAQYVLALSNQTHDVMAAERGRVLYSGGGRCAGCHGVDGRGNSELGVPNLHGPAWLYGGERDALRTSINDGRHGLCPAWIDRLDYADIRSLAVWLSTSSHEREGHRNHD